MSGTWVDAPVTCRDPECPHPQPSAQPETDGSLRYYACPCGYEFPVEFVIQGEVTCAAGIPESVRRVASFEPIAGRSIDIPAELTAEGRVFLGLPEIGRHRG